MKYFIIEPEVAGGFGEKTVLDRSTHPPVAVHFHHEFQGWLGDELLETVAHFVVTERLGKAIQDAELTGVELDKVEISKSDEFDELYPGRTLPNFQWLKIRGAAGQDDFGMSDEHRLVVSEKALKIIRERTLNHCDIDEFVS